MIVVSLLIFNNPQMVLQDIVITILTVNRILMRGKPEEDVKNSTFLTVKNIGWFFFFCNRNFSHKGLE